MLRAGTQIEAKTTIGTFNIIAGEKLKRSYKWGRCTLRTNMIPRADRWYGSLGIHDAGTNFFPWFFTCDGISGTVAEEGQIHFTDQKVAEWWVHHYASVFPKGTLWTKDGLVVRWIPSPSRRQLNVSVWQICIRGVRPHTLNGSSDQNLKVTNELGTSLSRFECGKVSDQIMIETRGYWEQLWMNQDARRAQEQIRSKDQL